MKISEIIINSIWDSIKNIKEIKTPSGKRCFYISTVSDNLISINTENKGKVGIQKTSFVAVMDYLISNKHTNKIRCKIKSSNTRENSGPLCLAARDANNDVRSITYIVPILATLNVLGMDGGKPNTTWLL